MATGHRLNPWSSHTIHVFQPRAAYSHCMSPFSAGSESVGLRELLTDIPATDVHSAVTLAYHGFALCL